MGELKNRTKRQRGKILGIEDKNDVSRGKLRMVLLVIYFSSVKKNL